MSNLIFNLRVFYWHFQIMRDRPFVRISANSYWKNGKWKEKWVELH